MGLDMYLKAEKYLSKWDDEDAKLGREIAKLVNINVGDESESNPEPFINTVKSRIGYWRKQNAIHNWFVQEVQDGEDNRQEYYVRREQLIELRDLCQEVLDEADPLWQRFVFEAGGDSATWDTLNEKAQATYAELEAICEDKLPTVDGFFFGGTKYDEWYIQGLRDTIKIVNNALTLPDSWGIKYTSSW